MAPIVSRAQQLATYNLYISNGLREATYPTPRENGGSSDGIEERDTSPSHLLTWVNDIIEKLTGSWDSSPDHSKSKLVAMAQAKAVSKAVGTAKITHKTDPDSTPKSVPHPKSSPDASPNESSSTSIHQNPSTTPISEPSKPIPILLSPRYPFSNLPPLQSHPPGKFSPSLSPPPAQKHSTSLRDQALGAGIGSAVAVGLLIGLFYLLRYYCRRGTSNEHSNSNRPSPRIDKQKRKGEEVHPGFWKPQTFKRKRREEEAHPRKRELDEARESRTGGVFEMVRPTQAHRRDFGSQFSPSLESQSQRDSEDQESTASEGEAEEDGRQLSRQPLAPARTISYLTLPSPVVGLAETATTITSGDARIVHLTPSSDGGSVGRVVSIGDGGEVQRVVTLGDSCVFDMVVRVMNDDDEEERRSDDGDRAETVEEERREIDGVLVTVTDLGTRVVEEADEESFSESRAVEWGSINGGLGEWVEDPHLDGHELDSEDERDASSFKSTRGSIEEGGPEEGEESGDDEQTEGAGGDIEAAGGVAGVGSADGSASPGSKGGESGYEDDADSYGGDEDGASQYSRNQYGRDEFRWNEHGEEEYVREEYVDGW